METAAQGGPGVWGLAVSHFWSTSVPGLGRLLRRLPADTQIVLRQITEAGAQASNLWSTTFHFSHDSGAWVARMLGPTRDSDSGG